MTRFSVRLFGFLALLSLIGTPVLAQSTAPGEDPVVARVNGKEIRQSDVVIGLATLPPQYASLPRDVLIRAITDKLVDSALVSARGRALGLEKDPAYKRALEQAKGQILEQLFMQRLIERRVTEKALKRRYDRDKKTMGQEKQVRARHILVKTRAEAMSVIGELQKGSDFAEVAKKRSIGPSKTQGGDLGYFKRAQMVPPFSAAAFALRKGETARAPVKTRFGWHVIKVEDIRTAAPPTFDKVKQKLANTMRDELMDKEMKELRKAAKIEILLPKIDPSKAPMPMPMPQGRGGR